MAKIRIADMFIHLILNKKITLKQKKAIVR